EFVGVFLDHKWDAHKANIVQITRSLPPVRRRRSFMGQLATEAAAYSGDLPVAFELVELAIAEGLFDLHWLDRCPLLGGMRADPKFASVRVRIKTRADAILDALYGDHEIGTSETAIASSVSY